MGFTDVAPSVFDPGLSVTEVATTGLSELDGDAGELRIRGYPIEDVAEHAIYETVAWLLFDGDPPTNDELRAFDDDLTAARALTDRERNLVEAGVAADVPVMDVLRVGLGAGSFRTDAADALRATRRVVAICPSLAAAYWRIQCGLDPVTPRDDLSHAANFLYMLSAAEPDDALVTGLETYLVTISEHGLNPSTFAARIAGSTGSDPYSAATAAVGVLKGPRHGGALERVHSMLESIDDETDLATLAATRVENDSLPGFGHSVYDVRDPRASIVERAAEHVFAQRNSSAYLETARAFEAAVADYLADEHPERALPVNVDYYAAVLLRGLEIPPELFTATFAVGRAAGWMAHYLEQLESEQLLRPRTRYVGPDARPWTPPGEDSGQPSASALERLSSTLDTLSDRTRLELLTVLYDATEPLSYSTLRSRTSIEDKGRYNYHLRQLRGVFVETVDGGYSLTEAGEESVQTLLDDVQPLNTTADE